MFFDVVVTCESSDTQDKRVENSIANKTETVAVSGNNGFGDDISLSASYT